MLNQAAQTAKRTPEFAACYAAFTKRRGKKIATIAIARKLLTRACQLLARPLRQPHRDNHATLKEPARRDSSPLPMIRRRS
jgi:transposase